MTHSQITSFIWSVADLIRDTFKRGKYQDAILPLTVLRRIAKSWSRRRRRSSGPAASSKASSTTRTSFSGRPPVTPSTTHVALHLRRLVDDPQNIAHNLRRYIQSFSPNMRKVIEQFDFDNTITKLDDTGLVFQVIERFAQSTCTRSGS